jgi:putative ABC transport system substrate-binding protein
VSSDKWIEGEKKHMTEKIRVLTLCAMLLALGVSAQAQQPTKVRKIGFLNATGALGLNIEAFRQGMRELGYIEGQNIVIEFRTGERSQLAQLANELVQQKVEVIVATGPAAYTVRTATETIPIVFSVSGDPIEAGLIDRQPCTTRKKHDGHNLAGV